MTLLRIENVWKRYHDHDVLRGVDLAVRPHEVVCLIGSSGSGKSTLLRCVNLLETVDDGVIYLDDQDITAVRTDADEVRKRIGMVFQAYNLFPHMTVLENICLAPRKVHKVGRSRAEGDARDLLARFGLADKANAYPDRLSGGQQQRVAIIRALATQPRLILLDEVTSALDPALVTDVLGVIRELKEGGMTMILATHEMGFAREIADTVCFLDGGVLLERGTPEEIFTAPREPRTREFLRSVLESRRL
ncbi:glutamine ABC transporter ATP-binding protein [Microtetraspora sp. NBRC 13810]|uniref:amino acid ABC transporter ATP-binding protein n=1 Tax=Microtetraspora sp. NBRC 13810 TaxID=3030990 RepID=UPI0024A03972|nr:amino acid ABC transporter ATP-binding protein [Microtetraspora sp. NBRC 13810]GLW12460.1 glutamine ABC transporter ATP-binding protein [Microtetraspora sp. NBRC 13810]